MSDNQDKSTFRAFIAVSISEEVRGALDDLIGSLKRSHRDVKWVRPEAIHITLKFLGDVERSLVPEITVAMERAAKNIAPCPIEVKDTGAFPNLKKPRVFWAGLLEKTGGLAELAARLENELKPLGFEPEKRAFKPHLTIGRVRRGEKAADAANAISKEAGRIIGSFVADEFSLYQSELKPDGAIYTRLETVELLAD